jgi:hypothetical protein
MDAPSTKLPCGARPDVGSSFDFKWPPDAFPGGIRIDEQRLLERRFADQEILHPREFKKSKSCSNGEKVMGS